MANRISRQDSRRWGRSKRDGRELAPRDETGEAKRRQPVPPAQTGQELSLLWSVVPGLAALVLYLSQAPPVSGDKDASEFTLVLATNGIGHETGYAVYSLLGHLFVRACHAAGANWAWGANAWSGMGGSVAIFALHGLSVRLIPAEHGFGRTVVFLAGLLPTALFGLNPIWTYETTLAEVYSWHIALCLILALVFAVNVRGINSERLVSGSAQTRLRAACWGLLCGLAGTHHTTAVFAAGPLSLVLLFALWRRSHTVWREVVAVAAGVCLPVAASAGFVGWGAFHPARWQWPLLAPTWQSVQDHLLATRWISTAQERRGVFGRWDEEIRAMWDSIPFEKAIVLWPSDISTKLVERQILFGEKPGIDVINPNLLGHEFPRRKFIERHGFDPVSFPGEAPRSRTEFVELTTRRISEASSLPVIDFRPEEKSVRLLRKP